MNRQEIADTASAMVSPGTGAKDLAGRPGEKITEGLDGLRERLVMYYQLGARFAKWRAVIKIGEGIPSHGCIEANAHALARYDALCQEAGIVPIVELWQGLDANKKVAQEALLYRAKCNRAARQGKYTEEMEMGEPALVGAEARHSHLASQD